MDKTILIICLPEGIAMDYADKIASAMGFSVKKTDGDLSGIHQDKVGKLVRYEYTKGDKQ
jgi:hypothetical protein